VKRHKRKGTATVFVEVPGSGGLKLASRGARKVTKEVSQAREVKLSLKSKGDKRRTLNRRGRVKVKAKVTFTAASGSRDTQSREVKLVKR
jgi:hypothetical protein